MGVVGIKESIGNKLTTRINISHLSKKRDFYYKAESVYYWISEVNLICCFKLKNSLCMT